jgi:hypothetical protein
MILSGDLQDSLFQVRGTPFSKILKGITIKLPPLPLESFQMVIMMKEIEINFPK